MLTELSATAEWPVVRPVLRRLAARHRAAAATARSTEQQRRDTAFALLYERAVVGLDAFNGPTEPNE